METDLGNALSSVASPGMSRDSLERLNEDVAAARERIERGRENTERGYAALNLPETTDPNAIRATVEPVADAEALVVVSIGSSALDAATLADALESDVETHVLDNVGPKHINKVLNELPLAETTIRLALGHNRGDAGELPRRARGVRGRGRRLNRADGRHDRQGGPAARARPETRPARAESA